MRGRGSRVTCARSLARFEPYSLNIVVMLRRLLLTLHARARDSLSPVVAMGLFQKSPTAFSRPAKTSNSGFSPAAQAATSGGRVYLYSGRDGHLIETYTDRIPGDTFGFDAVGIGDVDGDGAVDFLITAAWSGVHGNHSGRIFIVSGGVK